MNRGRKIALLAAAANLAVILLFPPFDSHSFSNAYAPIFAGFHLAFSRTPSEAINANMLFLESAVVLINACIAWLLLRDSAAATRRRFSYQNAVLLVVAINLVLILLFPPFENYQAVTLALLPSFQGFYFVFAHHPDLTLVSTLLYLEVIFVLVNGAILWLLFKEKPADEAAVEDALKLMRKLDKIHHPSA